MTACVHVFGMLKTYTGEKGTISVEAGRTVREFAADFGMPPDVIAMVLVNDEPQTRDYRLRDGDDVRLIAIVGGG